MEAKYIVLTTPERMKGDYADLVCNALKDLHKLNGGFVEIKKGPNNYAKFGVDNTIIDIYLDKSQSEESFLTLIVISRSIEEPVGISEKEILKVRKELSSLLEPVGLMIH
jgi:hypothetical protein